MYRRCLMFNAAKRDVGGAVEDEDGEGLDDIGDEVAVPQGFGPPSGHEPQHGDDRPREGERDEERHAMVVIELVDYHEHVDVAEGHEAEGEDTQGVAGLGRVGCVVGSEEGCDGLREEPHQQAGERHSGCDESECLANDQPYAFNIASSHLQGSQRL